MENTALITGASSGIGKELTLIHAQRGGNLVLVARSEDKLNAIKQHIEEKYKTEVLVIAKDLSEPGAAAEIYAQTQKKGIKISVLINNAGFGLHGKFYQQDLTVIQEMIQVNIAALSSLTHYYLQDMLASRSGKILNVSSTASFLPGPLMAVYYATKAYVTSFSQAIAEEVADKNISVTALCPGAVTSDFVTRGHLEGVSIWKRAASAQDVALFGYNAMQEGRLIAFNEKKLNVLLNWIIPFIPRKLLLKISRNIMEKR